MKSKLIRIVATAIVLQAVIGISAANAFDDFMKLQQEQFRLQRQLQRQQQELNRQLMKEAFNQTQQYRDSMRLQDQQFRLQQQLQQEQFSLDRRLVKERFNQTRQYEDLSRFQQPLIRDQFNQRQPYPDSIRLQQEQFKPQRQTVMCPYGGYSVNAQAWTDYLFNPNRGKAFELTNFADQVRTMRQSMEQIQADLDSTGSYVWDSLPRLSRSVNVATQAALGANRIVLAYDFLSAPLTAYGYFSALDSLRQFQSVGGVLSRARVGSRFAWDIGINSLTAVSARAYMEHRVAKMWEPINQGIEHVNYMTSVRIPQLRERLVDSTLGYHVARDRLINSTLDAVEIIQSGHDYDGVLRSALVSSGAQLSQDLMSHPTERFSISPVVVNYTNPLTNRQETTVLSQQTFDALSGLSGQRTWQVQMQQWQQESQKHWQQSQSQSQQAWLRQQQQWQRESQRALQQLANQTSNLGYDPTRKW